MKFLELDEKVQEKFAQEFTNSHQFEFDDYWEVWKLEQMGFYNPEIMFDISYSQGEGACFTCESIDILTFMQFNKLCNKLCNKFRSLYYGIVHNKIEIYGYISHFGNYCHERSHHLHIELNVFDEREEKKYLPKFDEFESWMKDFIAEYAQEIFFTIRRQYEYETSLKGISELYEDVEFDENGNLL